MMQPSPDNTQKQSISNRLLAWNLRFRRDFPSRLVGELQLSERDFRELLSDVQEYGRRQQLSSPPSSFFPRITLTIMTFTARYDYDGAFWPAFTRNIGLESLDQGDWGIAFRRALVAFKLFSPPEHWMVNVFPVLFHSIVPERSLEDFALMVRALCDVVDVRLLDDQALRDALESADLPILLKRFVIGNESRAVAQELVRHVAEDFRLGVDLGEDTLRGRILATMRSASESRVREFSVRVQPLPWRWDFNNGRCGVWLSCSRSFDRAPVALQIAEHEINVRSHRSLDSWDVPAQMLALPISAAGKRGALKSYGDDLLQVRIGNAPAQPPYIFRSSGNVGIFEPGAIGTSGDFAIAANRGTRIVNAAGEEVQCFEQLPTPLLRGAETAGIYSLSDGDCVLAGNQCAFTVKRATRPSVELRGRTSWVLSSTRSEIPVYSDSPRLEARSPDPDSTFLLFNGLNPKPVSSIPFTDFRQVRPQVQGGVFYRASISVGARSAGATSVEFLVLPLRTEIIEHDDRLTLCVFGQGSITVSGNRLPLSEDQPARIRFRELDCAEDVAYDYAGRVYLLRYSGQRPTLWGLDPATLDHAMISTHVDRIVSNPHLIVSGMPGSSVALSVRDSRYESKTIGPDGLATLSLKDCISMARAREQIHVSLITDDVTTCALTVLSVPQVAYDGITASLRGLAGDIVLDSSIDELYLEAQVFHAPWIPPTSIKLNGLGQRWSVDAKLPDQHWELSLVGMVSGVRVNLMLNGAIWARSYGTGADRRTLFDERLYSVLVSDQEGDLACLSSFDPFAIIQRCLSMLEHDFRRAEKSRIEEILRFCAERVRVRDIPRIEMVIESMPNRKLFHLAAECRLPVSAFKSLPFHVPGFVRDSSPLDKFKWFERMAASSRLGHDEAALAQVIADLEARTDPLIVAYARLLRQLRSRDTGVEFRLGEMFQSHFISEAFLEVENFGGISKWTGDSPELTSTFSLVVKRIWGLATISRRTWLADESDMVPNAVRLISPLIADDIVGEFVRLALSWVDQDVKLNLQERL